MRFKPGQIIGGWTLIRQIGEGGNGWVFEAKKGELVAAFKILKARRNSKLLARFGDEIRAMKKCKDLPGVLPLYGSFLDASPEKGPSWLAMAIATPLLDALGPGSSFEQVVTAIKGVATALVSVHELGLSHRDIKPENLFLFQDNWAVGDLGLVDFVGKEAETPPLERVGPIYYIAPEMLNNASTANGKPADVFSLAKTLWVLGTGQKYPLPGHLLAGNKSVAMSSFSTHERAPLLDPLIEAATCYEPEHRPTMCQFLNEIEAWLSPPVVGTQANIRSDVAEFKRLLEGPKAREEANTQAEAIAQQKRNDEGLRMRERLRPVALELQEALKEAGLLNTRLQIDNYFYGFEVSAMVPRKPQEQVAHLIRIVVHIGMQDAASLRSHLHAYYYHGSTPSDPLWECQREFLAGGSDEDVQIAAMVQDLWDQFGPAIRSVLMAAGIL